MNKGTSKVLLSCAVVVLTILILEIVLHTTHLFGARRVWSQPDPVLCYRFVPGSQYWYYKENDHPITGRINSYGWRDREWSTHKPEDVYRVAILGDSYVEAFQVEQDLTFLKLVENQWSSGVYRKIELMNFGRSGFTQTEELLVLKSDVRMFSPDMVIVMFFPCNDITDINKATSFHFDRPFYNIAESGELILDTSFSKTREFKVRSIVNMFQRKSALLSLIAERYVAYKSTRFERIHLSEKEKKTGPDEIGGYLSLCTEKPEPKYLQSYYFNKLLIRRMAGYCRDMGSDFMLVCMATPTYIPKNEKKYISMDSTFDSNFFEDDLEQYTKTLGVEYLGLQRVFRQAYESKRTKLHWGHWNYQGHEVVAEALINKLHSVVHNVKSQKSVIR